MFLRIVVIFFFKQKTAYEMRISDWSSDVCSSDLREKECFGIEAERMGVEPGPGDEDVRLALHQPEELGEQDGRAESDDLAAPPEVEADRKSVVEGKSVSVRVDLGGRRSIKKKTQTMTETQK